MVTGICLDGLRIFELGYAPTSLEVAWKAKIPYRKRLHF
jgi:hypothetical protein